jgi:hypothetical protein
LYGLLTGSTFSTPGMSSSERLLIICGSPNALITIESRPGATRPYEPDSLRRSRTSSTWSSGASPLIMMSCWSSADSSTGIGRV